MVTCSSCKAESNGFKGETAAYIVFALTIPLVLLFGPSMIVLLGIGLYVFVVHNSKKFTCTSCSKKNCPICQKELRHKNHCRGCNVAICPFCDSHQTHKRPLSWLSTLLGMLLFILAIISVIFLLFVGPIWTVLFVLILLYFSSPICKNCKTRIHTEYF